MNSVQPTPSPAHSERKPQLPALTGLRALLALGILVFHFTPPYFERIAPLYSYAYVYVGVFFLLSGYVLAYNYADRIAPLIKRDFWRARFARLYPVYLLALAISFSMLRDEWRVRSHADFFTGLILTPLLLQGWLPSLATFWNTVAWTLSAEVLLYATFPWLIRLPWPKSPRRLIALLAAIWAVSLVPHSLYILLNPDHLPVAPDRYTYGVWLRALKFTPPAYAAIFLAGVGLGKLQNLLVLTQLQRTLVAAASLLAIVLFLILLAPRVPYVLLHGSLMIPLFAALTIGLSGKNFVASILTWRPLTLLGEASYCLFLLHFNLLNLLRHDHVAERLHIAACDPWFSYAVTILLALAAYHLVEVPGRKALLRRRTVLPRTLSHPVHQI